MLVNPPHTTIEIFTSDVRSQSSEHISLIIHGLCPQEYTIQHAVHLVTTLWCYHRQDTTTSVFYSIISHARTPTILVDRHLCERHRTFRSELGNIFHTSLPDVLFQVLSFPMSVFFVDDTDTTAVTYSGVWYSDPHSAYYNNSAHLANSTTESKVTCIFTGMYLFPSQSWNESLDMKY